MKSLYGVPMLALTDVLANFMIEQGNSNRSHYADNLVRAARVWEDITLNTIFTIKYKAVPINKSDNSIIIPGDSIRVFSINVMDECGDYKPLACNPDMVTLRLDCPTQNCSCKACNGEGSYCLAVDAIQVVSETVQINGYDFTKRTYFQKMDGGYLQKVTELPYPELPYPTSGPPTVTYKLEFDNVCQLEVTPENCIKPTPANADMLKKHCGCLIPTWQHKMCCDHSPSGNYGFWNWDAGRNDKVILKDVTADVFIIAYQSSGNCGADELLIPRIALDAVQYGIVHRQTAWNPNASFRDKESARLAYNREKDSISVFLHPVSLEGIGDLQTIIPLW